MAVWVKSANGYGQSSLENDTFKLFDTSTNIGEPYRANGWLTILTPVKMAFTAPGDSQRQKPEIALSHSGQSCSVVAFDHLEVTAGSTW